MTEPHGTHEPMGLVFAPSDDPGATQNVPLTAVSIESRITGPLAEVAVTQTYANRENRPVEAMFVFPLPARAAVRSFAATIGDRRVVGTIADREEAFETYDDAIAEGHGAFLLDQERPNVFTTSVGNLEPERDVTIEITYVTELPRDGDELRLQIPTTIAPRYTPVDHRTAEGLDDAERVSPPITTGDPGYALDLTVTADLLAPITAIESPTHRLTSEFDGSRATIELAPNDRRLDRDFVLLLRTRERVEVAPRIETDAHGERTLLASFRPEIPVERRPVELLFVVDCSGSMGGTSIDEARRTLLEGIAQLGPEDRFGVVRFGSHCESLIGLDWKTRMERHGRGHAVDREHVFRTLPVDDRSLALARRRIESMEADLGGTEVLTPLEVVLSAPSTEGFSRRVVLITDGEVSNEEQVIAAVRDLVGDARVFTFGVGAGASEHLVRGIAEAGRGSAEMVVPGERIDRIVMRHFARITQGCLDDGRLEFEGLEVEDVTPSRVPPLAPGEEFLVLAKVRAGTAGRATLRGTVDGASVVATVEIPETAARPRSPESDLLPISWARRRIAELELEAADDRLGRRARRGSMRSDRTRTRAKRRIRELALAHSLVSSETSFVAVEERDGEERTIERAALRRVPVPMTRGWGGAGDLQMVSTYCGSLDAALPRWGAREAPGARGLRHSPEHPSPSVRIEPVTEVFCVSPEQRTRLGGDDFFTRLLELRSDDGAWGWSDELADLLGIDRNDRADFLDDVARSPFDLEVVLTLLVGPILLAEPAGRAHGDPAEVLSLLLWFEENLDSGSIEELSAFVLELRDRTLLGARV